MSRFGSIRRIAAVAAVIAAGGLGVLPGTADAATPPGLAKKPPAVENVMCNDGSTPTVFAGGGRSGWVNGTLYVVTSVTFEATFVPNDGSPTITDTFTKTYGAGPSGEALSCSASGTFDEPDGSGTFTATFAVVAVRGRK